jgi:uncharacterized protein (TIGR00369 family)
VNELATTVRARIKELHEIAPGSIGDQMCYEVLSSSVDGRTLHMRCRTFDWMRNGPGTLHGGMCATVVDQAMGFAAYCLKPGPGVAPTVQMQVEYHRPLIPGESALVDVHVVSQTKSLMHLSAEAYAENQPEKVCLTASATYFYKPAET